MKLGQYHELTADSNGFTLTYEKEGEVNPTTARPAITRKITYHSSLEQGLEAYLRHTLMLDVEAEKGIEELLNTVKEVKALIKAKCDELAIKKDHFTKLDS